MFLNNLDFLTNDLPNIFVSLPLLMKVKKGEKMCALKDIDYEISKPSRKALKVPSINS